MPAFDLPPPHGVVRGWLGQATVDRLLDYAQAKRQRFATSSLGYGDKARIDPARRVSEKLKDLGPLTAEIEARMREAVPSLITALGGATFTPAGFELELVAHNDDAFYARHKDTILKDAGVQSTRVISAVYYFHRQPKAFSGGVLRLHSLAASGAPGTFVDIEPEHDALAFFPSWYPHEVLPVSCPSGRFEDSRFAVNCWVHQG
jgi:SM-20-related protein